MWKIKQNKKEGETMAEQKMYYDKYDIQKLFECGESKAQQIIREIKTYTGNRLGIKGKVLVSEFNAWSQGANSGTNGSY